MVGHRCERAVATLAAPGASGAGVDILRQLAISASEDEQLRDVLDDFFPDPPRTELFLPEPGCSDPTFVGSAMDLAAYAGQLLTDAVAQLGSSLPPNALVPFRTATVVRSPELTEPGPTVQRVQWRNDLIDEDTEHDYQIRVAPSALTDIRRETARAADSQGLGCETGGLLLGQIDRASRVVWVTDAQQPPPGSTASASGLLFDPAAARASVSDRRFRTRGFVTYIGAWHTHPTHTTTPSTIDVEAMETLAQHGDPVLLLIIGGDRDQWVRWLSGRQTPEIYTRLFFPR
jgi:integrative and conjugative element protein (TIGR02256 family)